ncbi:tetratricopeptide repeat protein [Nonomuraea longicatena]|uniref:Tetratricopeptide repeat protein n=1 Tax=Nonomuraea longicatena TaxID=83682 RepID=A0ABN1PAG7_9ACTN
MGVDDLLARADRLVEEDDVEGAAALYAEAAQQGTPGAATRHGEMLFHLGRDDVAESVLRAALAKGEPDALDWLSDLLVETGRGAEAALLQEQADRALRAATIWADAAGDRGRAEAWYRKAVERGEPGALNDFGSFLSEDDSRREEAEALLRQAAEQGDALAFSNLGGMALDHGDPEAAAAWLRQGLELADQTGSTALLKLAVAEERTGNTEAARALYDRAVADGVTDAHVTRARFLADQGEPAEADFLAGLEKGEEGAHYYFGEFLAANGRVDEAVGHLYQAVEDGSTAAHEELALIYQSRGAVKAAEDHFKESIAAGWLSAIWAYAELLRQEGRGGEVAALVPEAQRLGATAEQVEELTR